MTECPFNTPEIAALQEGHSVTVRFKLNCEGYIRHLLQITCDPILMERAAQMAQENGLLWLAHDVRVISWQRGNRPKSRRWHKGRHRQ